MAVSNNVSANAMDSTFDKLGVSHVCFGLCLESWSMQGVNLEEQFSLSDGSKRWVIAQDNGLHSVVGASGLILIWSACYR